MSTITIQVEIPESMILEQCKQYGIEIKDPQRFAEILRSPQAQHKFAQDMLELYQDYIEGEPHYYWDLEDMGVTESVAVWLE